MGNSKLVTGTKDHYFDIADKLDSLGETYVVMVMHPDNKGAFVIDNISEKDHAQSLLNSICENFLRRNLIPNPDEDDADGDNMEPGI